MKFTFKLVQLIHHLAISIFEKYLSSAQDKSTKIHRCKVLSMYLPMPGYYQEKILRNTDLIQEHVFEHPFYGELGGRHRNKQ